MGEWFRYEFVAEPYLSSQRRDSEIYMKLHGRAAQQWVASASPPGHSVRPQAVQQVLVHYRIDSVDW